MYISLEEAKRHLNIEADNTTENTYIAELIGDVEDIVADHARVQLSSMADAQGKLPGRIRHAMLLLIGEYYKTREAASEKTPSYAAFDRLMDLFTNYSK